MRIHLTALLSAERVSVLPVVGRPAGTLVPGTRGSQPGCGLHKHRKQAWQDTVWNVLSLDGTFRKMGRLDIGDVCYYVIWDVS